MQFHGHAALTRFTPEEIAQFQQNDQRYTHLRTARVSLGCHLFAQQTEDGGFDTKSLYELMQIHRLTQHYLQMNGHSDGTAHLAHHVHELAAKVDHNTAAVQALTMQSAQAAQLANTAAQLEQTAAKLAASMQELAAAKKDASSTDSSTSWFGSLLEGLFTGSDRNPARAKARLAQLQAEAAAAKEKTDKDAAAKKDSASSSSSAGSTSSTGSWTSWLGLGNHRRSTID